jgi:hypothetical protein
MALRGMHEEGMAQIHRACLTYGRHLGPARRTREAVSRQLAQGQAGFTGRRELAGGMGSGSMEFPQYA